MGHKSKSAPALEELKLATEKRKRENDKKEQGEA